jgi:hypothetical protein
MTRYTAQALKDYPHDPVRVACRKCERYGQLRKAKLIEQYGPDIVMPDLRHLIAQCPRRNSMTDPCGVYYVDMADG